MLKRILTSLFSLLTITGGHLINRRWDRAAFFFVLAFLLVIWAYALLLMNLNDLNRWVGLFSEGRFFIAIVLVCASSAAFTYRDFAHRRTTPLGVMGVVGGCGITLMACLISLPALLTLTGWLNFGGSVADYSDGGRPSYIGEYMYFGEHDQQQVLPKPPAGDHWINGRITYQGEPASGVYLSLALNNEFRTGDLITDSNGEFRIAVPAGKWQLNFIKLDEWEGGPEDQRVMVLSGHEDMAAYTDPLGWAGTPLELEASSTETQMQLELTIVDQLAVTWPPDTDSFDAEPTPASMDDVLSWNKVAGATQYHIEISAVTRRGNSTRYNRTLNRELDNVDQLALSDVRNIPDDQEMHEYELSVKAYDKDGKFLTETAMGSHYRFALPNILLADEDLSTISEFDEATIEKFRNSYEDESRLAATETLIANDMLAEAESLLDKVTEPDEGGQLFALRGYIAAKRGQCDTAESFFSEAQTTGGKSCVPDRYRDACPVGP